MTSLPNALTRFGRLAEEDPQLSQMFSEFHSSHLLIVKNLEKYRSHYNSEPIKFYVLTRLG